MQPPKGDIVIVGGGPAGATTALALAAHAPKLLTRVVLLEAGTYPRDKYCAGALGRRGDAILSGLYARPDVPSVEIDGISVRTGYGEPTVDVGGIGRVVRRAEFDHALIRQVMKRGVKVLEGSPVRRVTHSGGRANVETDRGTLDACVVVGADGVGSVVRRAMGLGRGGLRAQALEIDTEPVPAERDRRRLHFDASDRRLPGYTWDFPTRVDGREMVCRGIYYLKVDDAKVDIVSLLRERLAALGLDLDAYPNKRFAERGYEPHAAVTEGPLILVGEAAGIDPVTGEGIAQAIEYGALAGRFLARSIGGGADLTHWTEAVRTSRVARDLGLRIRMMRAFYGASRPRLERYLTDCPSALYIGCQHFAAHPLDRAHLGRAAIRGGIALAASTIAALTETPASAL